MKSYITTKIYVTGTDKAGMYEIGEELGLSDIAMQKFKYVASEIILDILVDKDTGHAVCTHLNGVLLDKQIEI